MVNAIDMTGDLRPIGDRSFVTDLAGSIVCRLLQRQIMVVALAAGT